MIKHNINAYKSFQPKEQKNTFRSHHPGVRPINNTAVHYGESVRGNISEANKRVLKSK